MKNLFLLSLLLFSAWSAPCQITGRWTSVDDKTGKKRSIVEIAERSGKYYGRIVQIFSAAGENPDPVCGKCAIEDPRHNRKIIGMEILEHLVKDGEAYSGGQILDPENGKVYRCKIWIENKALKLRGYWGPFFRTQTWHRENSKL